GGARRGTRAGSEVTLHLRARGGIREQLVGLEDLLEDALDARPERAEVAAEVAVGGELLGWREEGLLDELRVRVGVDAEDLVVGGREGRLEGHDLLLPPD